MLEEQPAPAAPLTQIKPVFSQLPYYYDPYHFVPRKNDNKDELSSRLPVTPVGATVAQRPLPVHEFPIFPYDPEQDKPAAVAF